MSRHCKITGFSSLRLAAIALTLHASEGCRPSHENRPPSSMSQLECPLEMEMIMGGNLARQNRTIHSFCLDRTEVTVEDFSGFVTRESQSEGWSDVDASREGAPLEWCNLGRPDRSRHPMNCVSWHQAASYCLHHGKRLPNDSEWEWAAMGRDDARVFPWGDSPPSSLTVNACGPECVREQQRMRQPIKVAIYDEDDGFATSAPVGSKPAGSSRDGVLDMSGNVWEWTSSEYAGGRSIRGGGWNDSSLQDLSAIGRASLPPAARDFAVGFRCAKSLE